MAQTKVVLKVSTMTDDKTRQKVLSAAADIDGLYQIEADIIDQKLTMSGKIDVATVLKKLRKVGTLEIIDVVEAPKEPEKKEEKREENKEKKNKHYKQKAIH